VVIESTKLHNVYQRVDAERFHLLQYPIAVTTLWYSPLNRYFFSCKCSERKGYNERHQTWAILSPSYTHSWTKFTWL